MSITDILIMAGIALVAVAVANRVDFIRNLIGPPALAA